MKNLNLIMALLGDVKRITVTDNSEYDPERGSNGGCYSIWETYTRNEEGNWDVTYNDSSDYTKEEEDGTIVSEAIVPILEKAVERGDEITVQTVNELFWEERCTG